MFLKSGGDDFWESSLLHSSLFNLGRDGTHAVSARKKRRSLSFHLSLSGILTGKNVGTSSATLWQQRGLFRLLEPAGRWRAGLREPFETGLATTRVSSSQQQLACEEQEHGATRSVVPQGRASMRHRSGLLYANAGNLLTAIATQVPTRLNIQPDQDLLAIPDSW